MKLLQGKTGIIFGVANGRSIAWAIAQALSNAGMRLAFTYQGDRLKKTVTELAETLPHPPLLYPCDVTLDEEIINVFTELGNEFDHLDALIHSVAFAPRKDLENDFFHTTRQGFKIAQDISAYSLVAMARAGMPLLEASKGGASILTLTYHGSTQVFPGYNVMGVAKASLEACVKYLASDLGQQNVRVNALSAGPVNTLAARGIKGFTTMLRHHASRSPMKRNVELHEVGNAGLFLVSPMASGITGEILYVDCGYHIMAG